MLALTGAFAAACFVTVFGISFLGNPRSEKVKDATEAGIFMLIGMGILAVLCIVFGIFPTNITSVLSNAVYPLIDVDIAQHISAKGGFILTATDYHFGRISPFALLIAGVLVIVIGYIGVKIFGNHKTRIYETWGCGLDEVNPKAQYSATGFTYAIKKVFAVLYRPEEHMKVIENKAKYFLPEKLYSAHTYDIFDRAYTKITDKFIHFLISIRKIFQIGIIHVYLAFIMITLIALLIYVVWF
jgi:NADH:ubiquinone oxidoreductase subunit 5 (subunit L)/multisubunit Na+/H+ antiporter MnhA subunit